MVTKLNIIVKKIPILSLILGVAILTPISYLTLNSITENIFSPETPIIVRLLLLDFFAIISLILASTVAAITVAIFREILSIPTVLKDIE